MKGRESKGKVKERLKEQTYKFLSSISVHGVSRVIKTDHLLVRLVWIAMILLSAIFGFISINNLVRDYYSYDVITNIRRVTSSNETFPAITICSHTNVTKDYYFSNYTKLNSEYSSNYSIQNFINFGYTKEYGSSFKGQPLNMNQFDFFRIPKEFGNCVRFNGITNKDLETVNKTSDELILTLRLRLLIKEFPNGDFLTHKLSSFFRVYVADNHLNSFIDFIPLSLNSPKVHQISMDKTDIEKKLGEPYNPCSEAVNVTYRQVNCIENCINQEIQAKYNCSIPSYFKIGGLKDCSHKIEDLINEFHAVCEQGCKKECETSKFNTRVTTFPYPNAYYTSFYFSVSDFTTLEITQIPKMTEFGFVSGLGGSLGFFIGTGFLSLVEILEFFFDVFYVVFIEQILIH